MKKILIILLSIFVCSCSTIKEKNLNNIEYSINVFDKIQISELINDEKITIIDDFYLDSNSIGKKDIEIKYIENNKTYKTKILYKVIDDIKPILINVPKNITTTISKEIDLCSKAVFVDNYDRKPTCEIEGNYNFNEIGTYKLKYIIKDSSNNIIKKDLNLIVKEIDTTTKPNYVNDDKKEEKYYSIDDALKNYKNDSTMIGIDISKYQGTIDYQKIKEKGIEFVIIRIGVQSGYKKEISMDTFYEENIKNAREAGLKVGIYLYSTAISPQIAKEQAKWVIENLDKKPLDFPIAFDWENWQYIREYEISLHDLNETYLSFAEEIEKNGYKAMLYGSKYYLETMWYDRSNYPVWLAHYTDQTNYNDEFILWQFTNIGRVDGIEGNVDFDIYYKKES